MKNTSNHCREKWYFGNTNLKERQKLGGIGASAATQCIKAWITTPAACLSADLSLSPFLIQFQPNKLGKEEDDLKHLTLCHRCGGL